jgi:Thoeris protein ThsB, TIR-like domain
MARRVFFSFHFDRDIWRANQVRNANVVAGSDVAGFFDHSEYSEAKKKGDEAIKRMILRHLKNTSVTVVLIGRETANRAWVRYEIKQSIAQDNGLLGIYIHHLKNQERETDLGLFRPSKPTVPFGVEFPAYDWDRDLDRFRKEIEAAGRHSAALRSRH